MEIASLTKIMTLYAGLKLCKYFETSMNEGISVTKFAAKIEGTSAFLKKYDQLRLLDLFYAMMLPSGNDAALAMA